MGQDALLKPSDVAKRLNVAERTVNSWLLSGKLRGTRPGGERGHWRISPSDVDDFVKHGMNQAVETRGD